MRRFWAFIAMVVSLVVLVAFNVQSVYQQNNLSLEYEGGSEVVFQITQRADSAALSSSDISDRITKRLDIAGARNSSVEINLNSSETNADGKMTAEARVSLSPANEAELNNIVRVLKGNGPLTYTTANDITSSLVVKQSELQGTCDSVMELKYNSTTPIPCFRVGNATVFESLKTDAAAVSDTNNQKTIYVWQNQGPTTDENYSTAYGDKARDYIKAKIIGTLSVDNYSSTDSNDLYISISKDEDGNDFTIASARSYVNARNADDYGFDIKYLYKNTIAASYPANSLMMAYIGSGVGLLMLLIGMVLLYGVSGAVSGLSITVGTLFQVMVANFVGFELTPVTLLAVLTSICLGVFINANFFQRIKDEMRKGKSIDSAEYEGYRKSFAVTMMAIASVFFLALFGFLIGKGMIKSFCAVLFIGAVTDFLFVNYITKWMEYWITTTPVFAKEGSSFGLSAKTNFMENIAQKKNFAVDSKRKGKRVVSLSITGVVAAALLAGFLVFGLGSNKGPYAFFNNSEDYSSAYRVDISYTTAPKTSLSEDKYFSSFEVFKANVCTYKGLIPADDIVSYTFNYETTHTTDTDYTEQATFYVSLKLSKALSEAQVTDLKDYFDTNTPIELASGSSMTIYSKSVIGTEAKTGEVVHNNYWMFMVLGLTAVFAMAFFLMVYGLYASLGVLSLEALEFGLGLAFLLLTRLPFNSSSLFGILAAMFVTTFSLAPVFARYRELKRDAKIRKADMATRCSLLDQAMKQSITTVTLGHFSLLAIALALTCFGGTQLLSMGLVTIVCTVFSYLAYLYLESYMYLDYAHFFTTLKRPAFMNRPNKKGKKDLVSKNEPMETIIPGIND